MTGEAPLRRLKLAAVSLGGHLRWFDSFLLARMARKRRAFVLQFIRPIGGTGAELGVFKGHFTHELLSSARPQLLHAVDPWYLLSPTWPWAMGDRSTVRGLADTYRRNSAAIAGGQLVVHVADDREFLAGLADGALDWAYIDSSHAYPHTAEELTLLQRKVKPGGLITGDDWRDDDQHEHAGVARAVREFVASSGSTLLHADATTMQWALRLPNHRA